MRVWVTVLAGVLGCTGTVLALEPGQVVYVSGSVANVARGTAGVLDVSSDASALRFTPAATAGGAPGVVRVPYADIKKYAYRTEVAHHLGVAPAIAVALVKRRERKHFLTITFADEHGSAQVMILELSKHDPPALLAVLRARCPRACTAETAACVRP